MSYAIHVIKDADGIRLGELSPTSLTNIPDGTFTVSGHKPVSGTSRVATLSVVLFKPTPLGLQVMASSSASYLVPDES